MKNIIALIVLCMATVAQGQQLNYNRFVTTPDGTQVNGNVLTNVAASHLTNCVNEFATNLTLVKSSSIGVTNLNLLGPISGDGGGGTFTNAWATNISGLALNTVSNILNSGTNKYFGNQFTTNNNSNARAVVTNIINGTVGTNMVQNYDSATLLGVAPKNVDGSHDNFVVDSGHYFGHPLGAFEAWINSDTSFDILTITEDHKLAFSGQLAASSLFITNSISGPTDTGVSSNNFAGDVLITGNTLIQGTVNIGFGNVSTSFNDLTMGYNNNNAGQYSTILGGGQNSITGGHGGDVILGGFQIINGGGDNAVAAYGSNFKIGSGAHESLVGGYFHFVSTADTVVLGWGVTNTDWGDCFVWSDGSTLPGYGYSAHNFGTFNVNTFNGSFFDQAPVYVTGLFTTNGDFPSQLLTGTNGITTITNLMANFISLNGGSDATATGNYLTWGSPFTPSHLDDNGIATATVIASALNASQSITNGGIYYGNGSGISNISFTTYAPSLIWTNFAITTRYTNVWSKPVQVSSVSAVLTEAGVVGISKIDAVLTNGTISTVSAITAIGGLTGSTTNAVSSFIVPSGGWWWFTNTSSGAGNSSSVTGGQILVY